MSPVGRLCGPLLVIGSSCRSMGAGGSLFAALTSAALASVLLAKTEPPSPGTPNPRGGPFGVFMGGSDGGWVTRFRC